MLRNAQRRISIRHCNEAIDIEVFIRKNEDLITQKNYSSPLKKVINKELDDYIFFSAKQYSLNSNLNLVINICSAVDILDETEIISLIREHFNFMVKSTKLYLKQKFKQWKQNISIGGVFLIICLFMIEFVDSQNKTNFIRLVKESLLIMGWVALWEPITFILFGWEPIYRDQLLYEKLSTVPILINMQKK